MVADLVARHKQRIATAKSHAKTRQFSSGYSAQLVDADSLAPSSAFLAKPFNPRPSQNRWF